MTPLGNSAILVKSYIPNNGGKRLEGADLHFKEERYEENLRCTTLHKKATLRLGVCTGCFSAELHYGTLLDMKLTTFPR